GLPEPPPRRARRGGHPPLPVGGGRRGIRNDPLRRRPEDGNPALSGPYVIGCDVGSQGTNAALYSVYGTLVASAYEQHRLSFPRPAWAEQDPEDWIRALHATIARLVRSVAERPAAGTPLRFCSQLAGGVV